ncbi:hypothetical protein [Saccharolobus shibatae]|uniref:Uncharacterized protein n=1 Tax=Saccharolobus shibatae TaxID=2286 RepID=A0A8F5BV39_9CREN|nr:hypothetical protein [Saccharolobus shibatae]QXJ32017.1 hypothetical protein J5U21_01668 [Saccharolobus shibatae]
MTEDLKKWFNDFLNRISEKIKRGEELSELEMQIVVNYVTNLQLFEHVDRRISDVERNLRDEIRKTREELLANDEKIKQELLKEINNVKGELEKKIEDTRTELKGEIATVKGELEKKIEDTRVDLEKKIEDTRTELKGEIATVKGELEKKIEDTRVDLEKKISEVDSKVDATKSDLGLVAEEVYIGSFVDFLSRVGEKVVNVYRHFEVSVGEIDALVETQNRVYVVEVKMKAEFKDIDSLLVKAKAVAEEYKGKEIVPVLTGSKISKTVRGYAKGYNVMVV